jgi:nucleoid-associated protein YgaU
MIFQRYFLEYFLEERMIQFKTRAIHRILQAAPLFALIALSAVQCGKQNVPVEELARARKEIEMAQAQEPGGEAANLLEKATNTLLEAHALLPDGKNSEAAAKSIEARTYAVQSRLESAPGYAVALQEKSNRALEKADEAFAEALARDDYASARSLHEEGTKALGEAEATQVTREQRDNPLADKSPALERLAHFQLAFEKFSASIEASERARAVSLSHKSDMMESASTVEAMLAKAKEYGIEKYDASGYQSTTALIASARQDIAADKLKSANEKIVTAESQATALLQTAQKGKAEALVAEAEKAVEAAEADFNRTGAKIPASNRVKYSEYLKASQEALDSSKNRLGEEMYEESIQESREAIRLANLVREGSALSARELARLEEERKKAEMTRSENRDSESTAASESAEESVKDDKSEPKGQRYTVRKTRPAESLWRISSKKEIYGKGSKWKKIYDANRDKIKNPDRIYPGQELVIPK